MAKEVIFEQDARAKILAGVDGLANAVRVTLGPKGRNVIIDKSFGSPTITKDGVTVAKEIEFEDKFENMGAQMVKEVASKTSDIAGDGTTTATVLAQAIFREGSKLVVAGMNPMDLKRGIDKAVKAIVTELGRIAKPTRDSNEIAQVGTISANSDETIGQILAEAMGKALLVAADERSISPSQRRAIKLSKLPPGRSVRPTLLSNNVSPVNQQGPLRRQILPGVWPGVGQAVISVFPREKAYTSLSWSRSK